VIAVVQRVARASVEVNGEVVGVIERGLCVLLGIERGDADAAAARMAAKIAKLRIFPDDADKMNRSVQDVGGAALMVSQFTLAGDASGGNRPSFVTAAPPDEAAPLVERVCAALRTEHALPVATGRFQAHMLVRIENDGPVTIILRT
jgi:D-aminoacyl-tRNA deacylase